MIGRDMSRVTRKHPVTNGQTEIQAVLYKVGIMALGDCWKQLSWFYYQYLLVTALYMLEPWERTVFSILFCVEQPS